MYDAAVLFAGQALRSSRILQTLGLDPGKYVLATVHRAENTDDSRRLLAIFSALEELSAEISVVFPVHPRTLPLIPTRRPAGLRVIGPIGYLDMIALEKNAAVIATDSGGVQKEAFFHRVPCVTLRDETEWQELIDLGWNRLAPPVHRPAIIAALRAALADGAGLEAEPYGNGHSSDLIADTLLRWVDLPNKAHST